MKPEARILNGPVGRLDTRWHGPVGGNPVLLLHPHPQMGGTMGSRLVFDLATSLASPGFRVVRFDFRGVGRSEGAYGRGIGEADDATFVFDALAAEAGRRPAVVGYSFGAGVALRLSTMRRPAGLVLVAMPVRFSDADLHPMDDAPRVTCPTHIILGSEDGFVSVRDAGALAEGFRPPAKIAVLPGAAHFLEPSHNPAAVAAVLAALT